MPGQKQTYTDSVKGDTLERKKGGSGEDCEASLTHGEGDREERLQVAHPRLLPVAERSPTPSRD